MDVIETTIQCTRKTVSSALVTMTCLSAPLVAQNRVQDSELGAQAVDDSQASVCSGIAINDTSLLKSSSAQLVDQQESQEIIEAIAALEEQLKLYKSRALYAQREADRLLTLDWVSYRRYINEARRYDKLIEETEKRIADLKSLLK